MLPAVPTRAGRHGHTLAGAHKNFLASLAYFATFSHGKIKNVTSSTLLLILVSIQRHFFQTPKPNELLFRVHFHLEKEQFIPVTLYFDP